MSTRQRTPHSARQVSLSMLSTLSRVNAPSKFLEREFQQARGSPGLGTTPHDFELSVTHRHLCGEYLTQHGVRGYNRGLM